MFEVIILNNFEVVNLTNENIDELKYINDVILLALKYENVSNANFNILIVDDEEIHKINKEYRNVDRVTDVISFALEDNLDIVLPERMLGDIYISIDRARVQAIEYNHSLKRELCFLALHGLLHLLGYDHMKKEDEDIMFSRQEMILNELQITR